MHIPKRDDADASNSLPAKPLVVNPSGKFDGNDGRWSTFLINVGDDGKDERGQNFRVLISTSSALVLLPQLAEWCNTDCANSRGVEQFKESQPRGLDQQNNWDPFGNHDIPMPPWYTTGFLGEGNKTLGAYWGVSNVGLGAASLESVIVANRYVAGNPNEEFYMGTFGLAVGDLGPSGANKRPFLTELDAARPRWIASSSYGYTAGASYRNDGNGILGNLVLGGYDKSRIERGGISISMPSPQNNTLVVGIQGIHYNSEQGIAKEDLDFTTAGFRASIDSTFPYLVLPDYVCDKIAAKYGLEYDDDQKLYTVNSTMHKTNVQLNSNVTFKVGSSASNSVNFTNIVLPYAAFDLEFTDPVNSTSQKYFPIKKSKNGRYVMGRTFLQEAYIVVDYERANFTVAPAYNTELRQPNLVSILSPGYVPPSEAPGSSGEKLPTGAVAGIVVGIVIAFIIAGLALFCFWKKRKNAQQKADERGETSEIDTALADSEIKRRRISELTGSETIVSPKTPLQDYWSIDHKSVPPISEMSPDSPPAELYSPPAESASDREGRDYFTAGKPRRHTSGHNTPGTPAIAELPGDEGQFYTPSSELEAISPIQSPVKGRVSPSDTSLTTNIDERLADSKKSEEEQKPMTAARDPEIDLQEPADAGEAQPDLASTERRPSHTRGLSETTVQSDTTAVSQPTPEEEARWAREPRRPLSD